MTQPTLKTQAEGRTIAVVGDVYRFLATGEDTNGKYAMWEAIVPPGGGPPPHIHSREEEGFYILEGEITFMVGDQRVVATAGMAASDYCRSLSACRILTQTKTHSTEIALARGDCSYRHLDFHH